MLPKQSHIIRILSLLEICLFTASVPLSMLHFQFTFFSSNEVINIYQCSCLISFILCDSFCGVAVFKSKLESSFFWHSSYSYKCRFKTCDQ